MTVEVRVSLRCEHEVRPGLRCNRRLLDVVNEILTGQLVLEIKCPACGYLTKTAVGPYKEAVA